MSYSEKQLTLTHDDVNVLQRSLQLGRKTMMIAGGAVMAGLDLQRVIVC